MELIVQIVAGLIGGNAAGAVLRKLSLGAAGNSIAGVVGGGLGGLLAGMATGAPVAGTELAAIAASVAGGGAGGAALVLVLGAARKMLAR
jgi:uncharacterized membrane protein YeaQ/YmgE (transglycosylase-associated protein family)